MIITICQFDHRIFKLTNHQHKIDLCIERNAFVFCAINYHKRNSSMHLTVMMQGHWKLASEKKTELIKFVVLSFSPLSKQDTGDSSNTFRLFLNTILGRYTMAKNG